MFREALHANQKAAFHTQNKSALGACTQHQRIYTSGIHI